jgi:16S rRNA (guanine(966)-N(2))-methyltransferase RsmD
VLDVFSGTGALSIEAISRGAERAVLIERSGRSLSVIRQNLASLGLEDRAEVVAGDASRSIRRLAGVDPFDLVFLDPPYGSDCLGPSLQALVETDLLAAAATVVVEGSKRHPLAVPRGLVISDERNYGDTRVTWLSPQRTLGHKGE